MSVEGERRAGLRFPVKLYGLGCMLGEDGHTSGDVFTIDVRDAGIGGVRLDSVRLMEPGRMVHLICRLSEFRAVPVVATVVWSRPAGSSNGIVTAGAGLRYAPGHESGIGKLLEYSRSLATVVTEAAA